MIKKNIEITDDLSLINYLNKSSKFERNVDISELEITAIYKDGDFLFEKELIKFFEKIKHEVMLFTDFEKGKLKFIFKRLDYK